MTQRTMLIIAAGLTAFVLVLVGGLANRLSSGTAMVPTATTASAPAQATEGTLDPTVEALIREREAAYQQALAEANSRLEQANQQLAEMAQQTVPAAEQAVTTAPAVAPAVAPVTYAVTPEQAQQLALERVPGATLIRTPEVVSYQGVAAYEVVLDQGTLYLDAQSAAVLADSTTTRAASGGQITAEEAAQAALLYAGGGTVRKTELEQERGVLVYEVKFADESEIYVDATTGQVIYAKIKGERHSEEERSR